MTDNRDISESQSPNRLSEIKAGVIARCVKFLGVYFRISIVTGQEDVHVVKMEPSWTLTIDAN